MALNLVLRRFLAKRLFARVLSLVGNKLFFLGGTALSILTTQFCHFLLIFLLFLTSLLFDAPTKLVPCKLAISFARAALLAFNLNACWLVVYVDARRGLVDLLTATSLTQNKFFDDVFLSNPKLHHPLLQSFYHIYCLVTYYVVFRKHIMTVVTKL